MNGAEALALLATPQGHNACTTTMYAEQCSDERRQPSMSYSPAGLCASRTAFFNSLARHRNKGPTIKVTGLQAAERSGAGCKSDSPPSWASFTEQPHLPVTTPIPVWRCRAL